MVYIYRKAYYSLSSDIYPEFPTFQNCCLVLSDFNEFLIISRQGNELKNFHNPESTNPIFR